MKHRPDCGNAIGLPCDRSCDDKPSIYSELSRLRAENERAREILAEVALPPYTDSNLSSLLDTLRARAAAFLSGQERVEGVRSNGRVGSYQTRNGLRAELGGLPIIPGSWIGSEVEVRVTRISK